MNSRFFKFLNGHYGVNYQGDAKYIIVDPGGFIECGHNESFTRVEELPATKEEVVGAIREIADECPGYGEVDIVLELLERLE